MPYDFDTQVDRRNSRSLKWDSCAGLFGKEDLIPLWVADMDFQAPPAVIEELNRVTAHGVFGYVQDPLPLETFAPIAAWTEKRHGHRLNPEHIRLAPGVVASLFAAVNAFTQPGGNVIIQPPVYPPFFKSVKDSGRTIVENPLVMKNGRYHMDFDHLKQVISTAGLFILCNPHNPGGSCWSREELTTLSSICEEAGVLIVSDEIHADLVFKPNRLTPFRSVNARSLTLYAGSKTFNIPGLSTSMAYSEDADILEKFTHSLHSTGYHLPSCHGLAGNLAAFAHGAEWLDELLDYLKGNAEYVSKELAGMGISMPVPESTYLGWMDCRSLNKGNSKELAAFFTGAGLALNSGADYGSGGEAFMRINLACSRSLLQTAMQRLKQAIG